MDGDFENWHVTDVTLRDMSAMKIVHQILMSCGISSATEQDQDDILMYAYEKARRLKLSRIDTRLLLGLMRPVFFDMTRFYKKIFNLPITPVYTAQGPVDVIKSTEAIVVDERIRRIIRFYIACEFCHGHVFKLLSQLSVQEIGMIEHGTFIFLFKGPKKVMSVLPNFWLEAYRSNSLLAHLEDPELLQRSIDAALALALETSNNVAIRFFLAGASEEGIKGALASMDRDRFLLSDELLPATVCSVFGYLSEDHRKRDWGHYMVMVLDGLLKWPYQSLFLKTLRRVVLKLGLRLYSKVLNSITIVIRERYIDYSYRILFIESWKMGVSYWPEFYLGLPISNSFHLFDAFMTFDKPIIDFVIKNVPDEFKGKLLLKFGESKHCQMMFLCEEYDAIKLIVREFGLHNRAAMSEFKYSFITHAFTNPKGMWRNCCIPHTHEGTYETHMRICDNIFDDLIAEIN